MSISDVHPGFFALLLLGTAHAAHAAAGTDALSFDVYYDDRRIGNHHFMIEPTDDGERVRSEARFEYRLLFVRLYRYRHDAVEIWRDGCLHHLESQTDDNGRRESVPALPEVGTECPGSFAYWDLERLRRESLINPQTGESIAARLVPGGEADVDGQTAKHYRLELAGMPDIDLWYQADDGLWLGLETQRDSGTLRYRLRPQSSTRGSLTSTR
jgi:hypothetical protein